MCRYMIDCRCSNIHCENNANLGTPNTGVCELGREPDDCSIYSNFINQEVEYEEEC